MALSRRVVLAAAAALIGLTVGGTVAMRALTGEETRDNSSLGPAITALRGVPLPPGTQTCTLITNADLCWTTTGTEVAAVPALLTALRGIGATDLAPRCVRKRQSVLCRVDGNVAGSALDTLVSRNGSVTQVVVYAALEPPPDILRGGTPVPLR